MSLSENMFLRYHNVIPPQTGQKRERAERPEGVQSTSSGIHGLSWMPSCAGMATMLLLPRKSGFETDSDQFIACRIH